MRDVRLTAIKKALEARWPGCRVIWEPYRSPDDPLIQGWIHVLHVRERDRHAVDDFAMDLADRLFPGPSRFFISAVMPEHEPAMLRRLGLPPRRARVRRVPSRVTKGARAPRRSPPGRARARA